MHKPLAAALCAAVIATFSAPAAASPVTRTFDLIGLDQAEIGRLSFSYDLGAPLVSPISSSLGMGTVFFAITDFSLNITLEEDTPAGRAFSADPPTTVGAVSRPGTFSLTLADTREDGLAIIFFPPTPRFFTGFAFIEASPATAFGFGDVASFSWTLLEPRRPVGPGELLPLRQELFNLIPEIGVEVFTPNNGLFQVATLREEVAVVVPEPASGLLLAGGLGLLGLMARRVRGS